MKTALTTSCMFVFLSLITQGVGQTPFVEQERELRGVIEEFRRLSEIDDRQAVREIMAEDYVRIGPNGDAVRGRETVLSGVSNAGVAKIAYEDIAVSIFPEAAVVTYLSTYRWQDGRVTKNRVVRLFAKRGGKWKMLAGQGIPVS